METLKLSSLPPISLAVILTSLLGCYLIAKNNCHINETYVPFISSLGAHKNEDAVFCFFGNIYASCYIFYMYIYQKFLNRLVKNLGSHIKNFNCQKYLKISKNTTFLGMLGNFGLIIICNFNSNRFPYLHYTGAAIALIFLPTYHNRHKWPTNRN